MSDLKDTIRSLYAKATISSDELIPILCELLERIEALETRSRIMMPRAGMQVICIEDESMGNIEWVTAGGDVNIYFGNGVSGFYPFDAFQNLFRYA